MQLQQRIRRRIDHETRLKNVPHEVWALQKMSLVRNDIQNGNFKIAAAAAGFIFEHLELELSHLGPMMSKLHRACLRRDRQDAIDSVNVLVAELRMLQRSK